MKSWKKQIRMNMFGQAARNHLKRIKLMRMNKKKIFILFPNIFKIFLRMKIRQIIIILLIIMSEVTARNWLFNVNIQLKNREKIILAIIIIKLIKISNFVMLFLWLNNLIMKQTKINFLILIIYLFLLLDQMLSQN